MDVCTVGLKVGMMDVSMVASKDSDAAAMMGNSMAVKKACMTVDG